MMRLLLVLLLAALSGCSTIASNDLAQASGLATAAGDDEGATCWKCLARAHGAPAGVFTLIEQARLVRQCRAACVSVILP